MRPIYWQMVAVFVVVCVIAIIHLNNKVDSLQVQLKKAEGQTPKPANQPVANTAFKPVNPST